MKTLKKEENPDGRKRAVNPSPSATPASSELLTFWESEIDELQNREFSSQTEAIDFVLSRVLKRMSVSDENGAYKDFLVHLIELDPEMKERLSRSLKIREQSD